MYLDKIKSSTVKADGTMPSTHYDIGIKISYKVINVTSADKLAKDDMTVSGIH